MTPSPSPSFFMHQLHLWAANRCSNSSKPHIYSEHPPRKRGGFCHQHSKYKYLGLTMSGVTFSPFHTYQWLWLNKWELGLPWTNQAHPWSLRWGQLFLRHLSCGRERCSLHALGVLLGRVKTEMTPGIQLKKKKKKFTNVHHKCYDFKCVLSAKIRNKA